MADPYLVGYALDVADKYGLPPSVFLNQVNQESGFNQYGSNGSILTSWAGALGVAQILPKTAANPGYGVSSVDPNDPYASLDFMGQYDAAMLQRTGSVTGMLEAYNAGLGNLSGGAPYAKSILNSGFADGAASSAAISGGTPSPSRNGLTEWFTNPGQALKDAVAGASAVTAGITGKTTNGITPDQAGGALAKATGADQIASGINGLTGKLFSSSTWQSVAIAVLGIVLILGALFWLASSGKATAYIQSAQAA